MKTTAHDGHIIRNILKQQGHSIMWLAKVTGKDRTTWGRKLKSKIVEETYLFLLQEALKLDITHYFPRLKKFDSDQLVQQNQTNHTTNYAQINSFQTTTPFNEIKFLRKVCHNHQFVIEAKDQIIKSHQADIYTLQEMVNKLQRRIKELSK